MPNVPLVRTEGKVFLVGQTLDPKRFVALPPLARASKSDETRSVERELDLGDSLYLYVGHACPAFGDLVLVYAADMADAHPGGATPFDTGGLHAGKVHTRLALAAADHVGYCTQHARPLNELRGAVDHYLAEHFASPAAYITGDSPSRDDPTGRLLHPSNSRRAWTWEVRLWRDHDLRDSLKHIWMSADYYEAVRQALLAAPGEHEECRALLRGGTIEPAPATQSPHGLAEKEMVSWL